MLPDSHSAVVIQDVGAQVIPGLVRGFEVLVRAECDELNGGVDVHKLGNSLRDVVYDLFEFDGHHYLPVINSVGDDGEQLQQLLLVDHIAELVVVEEALEDFFGLIELFLSLLVRDEVVVVEGFSDAVPLFLQKLSVVLIETIPPFKL